MKKYLPHSSTPQNPSTEQVALGKISPTWVMSILKIAILLSFFYLTSLPLTLGASQKNIQDGKPTVDNNLNIPPRTQEIPIPADRQCLYKSIIIAYLLPVAHDIDLFSARLVKLIGEDKIISTQENKDDSKLDEEACWNTRLLQSHFLSLHRNDLLVCLRAKYPFLQLVKDIKQYIGIRHDLWGGPKEIQQIANHLQVTIQEYSPNPANKKVLKNPLNITPENKKSLSTLCIVQDTPTPEETVDITQEGTKDGVKKAKNPQHYRVLFPVMPPVLEPSTKEGPPIMGEPVVIIGMKDQKQAVNYARMIKEGIVEGDRSQLFKGLQLLNTIKIVNISNPRIVLEKLLDALTCTEIEWEAYTIKRHIAKAMRPFVYSMYWVAKQDQKKITVQHKQHLLKGIKKMIDLINESTTPGNGLRFELDVVEAMLKALPDTSSAVDLWADSIMDMIAGVKDKDPKKLFSFLKTVYSQLKDKQAKKWYEIVVYIDYYKKQASKDLKALHELQELLYFYKQPRLDRTNNHNSRNQSSKKWNKTIKKGLIKIDPTNPGGDWHILYMGIEALTYVVKNAIGSSESEQQRIMQQALESTDKERPGLVYYFDFNKIRKLGIKSNNWRLREKAFESAFLLENHPNETIQRKVQQFLENYKHHEEDKRVQLTLLPFHTSMVVKIEKALQKNWTTYKKGISKNFYEHKKLLEGMQNILNNKKNSAFEKLSNLLQKTEKTLEQTQKELKKTKKELKNKTKELNAIKKMLKNTQQKCKKHSSDDQQNMQHPSQNDDEIKNLKDQLKIREDETKQLKNEAKQLKDETKQLKNQLKQAPKNKQSKKKQLKDLLYEEEKKLEKSKNSSKLMTEEAALLQIQHAQAKEIEMSISVQQNLSLYIPLQGSEEAIEEFNDKVISYPFTDYLTAFTKDPATSQDGQDKDDAKDDEKKDDRDDNLKSQLPEKLQESLAKSQVLLWEAVSERDKSLSQYYIVTQYKLQSNSNSIPWVPVLISLPNTYEGANLLEKGLMNKGLNIPTIQALQQSKKVHFLFILDGFDQIITSYSCDYYLPDKVSDRLKFDQWKHSKFLISYCTQGSSEQPYTQYLGKHPKVCLIPFSENQTKQYTSAFAQNKKLNIADWQAEQYIECLEQLPNLSYITQDPFLLSLALHTFPSLNYKKGTPIFRIQLYETFTEQCFQRKVSKLKKNEKITTSTATLKQTFRTYCEKLALTMFKSGQQVANAEEEIDIWCHFLTQEKRFILPTSPLLKVASNRYSFIHKSYQEYFVASRFISNLFILLQHQQKWKSYNFNSIDWNDKSYQPFFNQNPTVVRFMIDRLKTTTLPYSKLSKLLFDLIEYSKQNKEVAVIAANSATLLCAAGVSLADKKWAGIHIPNARLDYAFMARTDLSKSDCRGVSLRQAYLEGSQWQGAQVQEINFWEYPYWQHDSSIYSIAYSPNDHYMATGLYNSNIDIWDITSGKKFFTLTGHTDAVNSVSWAHDSSFLASASSDKTIRIWNPTKKKKIATLKGHTDAVNSVTYSHDSKFLVSASSDNTVRIWNPTTRQEISILRGHTKAVNSATWSHDSSSLASASSDKTVRIWDPTTGKNISILRGHTKAVNSVSWAHDSSLLVSASSDKTLHIWNPITEKKISILRGHTKAVNSATWSHDSSFLASSSSDNTVRIWDPTTGKNISILRGHTDAVNSVSWAHDSSFLVSASSDKTLHIWNPTTGTEIKAYNNEYAETGTRLSWSHASNPLAARHYQNDVHIWNLITGKKLFTLKGHTKAVTSVTWCHYGSLLASVSADTTVRIWDPTTGKELLTLTGHTKAVNSVTWSHDSSRIASLSKEDSFSLIWNTNTGEKLFTLTIESLNTVTWFHDSSRIALGSTKGYIFIWDTTTGQKFSNLPSHNRSIINVSLSHDSRRIAVIEHHRNYFGIFNTTTGKNITWLGVSKSQVMNAVWSHDSSHIAAASSDKYVRIWKPAPTTRDSIFNLIGHKVASNKIKWPHGSASLFPSASSDKSGFTKDPSLTTRDSIFELGGHKKAVNSVNWSHDSALLASASSDKTVRIWNPTTGKNIFTLKGHTDAVTSVTWSHDSSRLASVSNDNTVRIWNPANGTILQILGIDQPLILTQASFKGAIELSDLNKKLIKQRGGSIDKDDEKKEYIGDIYDLFNRD